MSNRRRDVVHLTTSAKLKGDFWRKKSYIIHGCVSRQTQKLLFGPKPESKRSYVWTQRDLERPRTGSRNGAWSPGERSGDGISAVADTTCMHMRMSSSRTRSTSKSITRTTMGKLPQFIESMGWLPHVWKIFKMENFFNPMNTGGCVCLCNVLTIQLSDPSLVLTHRQNLTTDNAQ